MKSFESYRQLVILFWGPIYIKNTFYVIACSIPFVLLLFWSVLFEKLDCKHLRGSHLLTFLWISGADLYVTSRWPDTSVFHSPIPALVPRPKFITPSWNSLTARNAGLCVKLLTDTVRRHQDIANKGFRIPCDETFPSVKLFVTNKQKP